MNNKGYTLLEMILVIVIIGILAGVAAQSMYKSSENERLDLTLAEMDAIARAITGDERLISNGYRSDFGYVGDIGSLPPNLDALIANPGGFATWNGPYLRGGFVENTDDYRNDAWGNAYSYAGGTTLQSSGGGSVISRRIASSAADLTSNSVAGTVRDADGVSPGDAASDIMITVYFPNGAGIMTSASQSPSRSGEFTFASFVPIGIHKLQAIDTARDDTVTRFVAVYPSSTALADVRFASSFSAPGGGGGIEFVDNSQTFPGGNCDNIEFQITNTGASPITITWIVLSWTTPEAYYRRIRYNNATVWNQPAPRIGSDDQAAFVVGQTILPGDNAAIKVEGFVDAPVGGSAVNMRYTTFTVTFSDGSSFDFTMGNCID